MSIYLYLTRYKSRAFFAILLLLAFACETQPVPPEDSIPISTTPEGPYLVVLGIAQDAGYPQSGCTKECCQRLWSDKTERKMVSCLGLVDPETQQAWLFDATPDFKDQLQLLETAAPLAGIFLTHAHIGHYTGLMHLGREVMGANAVPVFAMPKMANFLTNNGPWGQLVALNNIELQPMAADTVIHLTDQLSVRPLQVPHRDEYSETVGFEIQGPNQSVLFIPDIDKWGKWERDINALISHHDYAFLDGSFYENGEIPGRDMSQIPHPFVAESMQRFSSLSTADKGKVHFIHFNHTNPLLWKEETRKTVEAAHYKIAEEQMIVGL